MFRDLANVVLQSVNWELYRKRFISAQKMELKREHFRAIIFYNFRRGLTQQQCID